MEKERKTARKTRRTRNRVLGATGSLNQTTSVTNSASGFAKEKIVRNSEKIKAVRFATSRNILTVKANT